MLRMSLSLFMVTQLVLSGCGSKKSKNDGGGNNSEVQGVFNEAAGKYQVPARMMLAAAFLESNLNADKASTPYFQDEGEKSGKRDLGFAMTETAFGLSKKKLGISTADGSSTLEVQVEAYAKLVRESIDAKGIALANNPSNIDEKYYWIWELAQIHRRGEDLLRNVRIVWAEELMAVLNEGRIWQDPSNGEILELRPEDRPIAVADFPSDGQKLFRLQTNKADILNARRFEMMNESSTSVQNNPTHIKIIHCPLGLSACLELQDAELGSDVKIDAHYIIPQNDEIVPVSLQVRNHEDPVQLTNANGTPNDIVDAIVVMLVGNSGRYVKGIRSSADPTWFTAWQLRQMDNVVSGVCRKLNQETNGVIDANACSSPGGTNGVHFQHQELRATYRWGDIADYEKSIFAAYLRATDSNITGEATLEFPKKDRIYNAGENIEMFARFQPGAVYIQLEAAVRCPDEQLVWSSIGSSVVVGKAAHQFQGINLADGGPNGNGQHFLRAVVYGENHDLYGWAISDVFVRNYDPKLIIPAKECLDRE